jgi:hypothetical protein
MLGAVLRLVARTSCATLPADRVLIAVLAGQAHVLNGLHAGVVFVVLVVALAVDPELGVQRECGVDAVFGGVKAGASNW